MSSRLLAEEEEGAGDDVQSSVGAMAPEDIKEELFPAILPHYRQPAVSDCVRPYNDIKTPNKMRRVALMPYNVLYAVRLKGQAQCPR